MPNPVGEYKLVQKIKDPQFSVDHIDQYDLLLLIGQHDFQFCVVDASQQRCLLLEDYTFSESLDDEITGAYRAIIDDHQLLMAGYWNKVKLAIKSQHFTLIPQQYFSPDNPHHYLTLATSTPKDKYLVAHQPHQDSEAEMVFGAPKQLVERLKSIYPSQDIKITHQGSAFIEGVMNMYARLHYPTMFLHIGHRYVTVLVLDGQKIILYNCFVHKSSDDIVKYVLTVLQKLGMDQNESKVILWGNVPAQSDAYAALYRYIRNLSLGEKPAFLTFSHVFDEAPDHRYFDLYSLHLIK